MSATRAVAKVYTEFLQRQALESGSVATSARPKGRAGSGRPAHRREGSPVASTSEGGARRFCRAWSRLLGQRQSSKRTGGQTSEAPALFPKPSPELFPNTYAYESQPMVKPTGFREYDARWLFEKEINLMGVQALGLGLARLLEGARRPARGRGRPRLPQLFRLDQARADRGPDGGRGEGARHRPRHHADGLFRPVRARCARGRDGHGLAQRQRLDRREDGRGAARHLRPRGDGAPARHRDRRRLCARARRGLSSSCPIFRPATSPT